MSLDSQQPNSSKENHSSKKIIFESKKIIIIMKLSNKNIIIHVNISSQIHDVESQVC